MEIYNRENGCELIALSLLLQRYCTHACVRVDIVYKKALEHTQKKVYAYSEIHLIFVDFLPNYFITGLLKFLL